MRSLYIFLRTCIGSSMAARICLSTARTSGQALGAGAGALGVASTAPAPGAASSGARGAAGAAG
eukprot:CAMPEP_0175612138 /NCGR_PEP_ID=MMETSP0096-20121207/63672_1 /TAXON_ID=311494 /ORGANISM="Alexandrium monilatum, Strain CCMP3105" /LENGTH=63 /DNA_ID=CAMNT_0016917181 /DNA_START=197 /DNA_END=386 /DNA_ORIENTATION=-